MDIMTGLTAASTAIGIAKDLREIDKSVDEAGFKLKLSELVSSLADAKVALADAKEEIARLASELDQLKNGKMCPKCRSGRMTLQKVEPHHRASLSAFGVEDWTYTCDNDACGFEQTTVSDPHGAIKSRASKR